MQTLKSLFVTLLILGGAFLAYDRYLAPDKEKVVFKKPTPPKDTVRPVPTPPPAPTETPPTQKIPAPPAPEVPEVPKPEPSAAAVPPESAPSSATQSGDGFVPPRLPTVEDATLNWTRIPPSAFPRQVKLLQAATFKAGFGNTQVGAGASVTVLAAQNGSLTIAPNASSTLRTIVPIDSTDLKSVLTQVYDSWRMQRIADVRRAWEERGKAPASPPPPATLDPTGRPQRGSDGAYPLLLASMKSGAVTEITPQSITRWGDPEKSEVNGKPCWIVPVEFDAVTAFGRFSTEAIARVVDGRVTGWFYKGSGEVVP